MFDGSVQRRVTALEVEVRGIAEDVTRLRHSVDSVALKIESQFESLKNSMDSRSAYKDKQHDDSRKFTLGICATMSGGVAALCLFVITSVTRSEIHPLDKAIDRIKADLAWSQTLASKEIDDNRQQIATMYKELSGKDWPNNRHTTFPTPDSSKE